MDKDKLLATLFAIVVALICGISMKLSYKSGYEEAVKDFTVGKLKCDYIDGKIVWK